MTRAVATRFRLLASVLSLLLLAVILAAGGLWWLTRRSLPQLDGAATLPGLSAAVTVGRDALGVPTVRGASRIDVARALGYLHAQDRFFQMDLLRRRAAGELAELFGKAAVPADRAARVHGFRTLARKTLALLPPDQSALVSAYTAGVNAGLAALRARPFEYYVLRVRPQPWLPEDTILVGYAMVLDLQDLQDKYELMLATIQDSYGRTLLDFLAPRGTELDAALDGSTFPRPPVPGPEIIDLRKRNPRTAAATTPRREPALLPEAADGFAPGSNAMALAGSRTASGSALLANDMHLGLRVPNIWYRASLRWSDEVPSSKSQVPNPEPAAVAHCVTGVTIPGTPLVVAGSNGRVAWGFTNSYADTADIVTVEPSSIDPILYKNGADLTLMEDRHETIRVKSGAPVDMIARWTVWGPVIGEAEHNRSLALRWVFDDPAALNLNLLALETAPDVATALVLAPGLGLPTQNLIVADRAGAIGWTMAGRLPRRVGYDGRLPAVWAYGDRRWDGCLPPEDYPRIVSPTSGQLWSANNRPVGGDDYAKLGDGGYMGAARARQIRDDLAGITTPARPRDLLAVQLDDRARLLERWQKVLLAALTPAAITAQPARAELRRLIEAWNGHAAVDSVAYTLVRRWRTGVADRALGPVFEPCTEADAAFDFHRLDYEEPLWRLVQARPPNFLTPDYLTWDDLLLAAVDDVLRWADRQNRPLGRLTWGSRNTARIQHPFSRFLPAPLARLLDMPAEPLSGDNDLPRVQSPTFGASERFVVSPGHEEEGIFHMPGGQSGNPLSPFYRAGHEAWSHGEPTPFLPGPTVHTLRLHP
ncbi:MAG: penicillin acylase family protein [Opitutaceae bacterium]|nr:penicillin acylase family protein [Opitutaceae bacterium]